MKPALQRLVGMLVLLVAGMLSLPLAAYVLDGQGTENLIVPVRRGVGWGILAALVGVLAFWVLLSGSGGA